jgi:methionyl-tRNA formyltransferase
MPRPAIKDGLSKQARYRAAKKAAGLKEVRIWTFDTSNPEFMAKLKRDMEAIRKSEGEAEVMAFVEAITDWPPYKE